MPNTIADNLQRLVDAKTAIASAITEKGGTVNTGDGFEEFSADIATIPSGGGGGMSFGLPIVTDKGFGKFLMPEYTPYGIATKEGIE